MDEQAKENSEHAAERSSRLLQVELVQIAAWLRCVAFAEVFVAADYQPADDIIKKNYVLPCYITAKVELLSLSQTLQTFKRRMEYVIIYQQHF